MIFLGIAIPIGILLGLLLFFSGLYNRNRLAAAASGGLDMFTTNFENQLDSVENYLLNLSLNDATFRSLSEQTDRTRAYLDAYEIAQGFPGGIGCQRCSQRCGRHVGNGTAHPTPSP